MTGCWVYKQSWALGLEQDEVSVCSLYGPSLRYNRHWTEEGPSRARWTVLFICISTT